MTTKSERRRNTYAGNCKVCCVAVQPGDGWLYSDTHSNHGRSRHSGTGRWPKFVKCDRCHELGSAHRSQLPENAKPKPKTIGVAEIRSGRLECRVTKFVGSVWPQPVVELVLADGSREIVAQLTAITSDVIDVGDCYADGRLCFGGRRLTSAAEKELAVVGWHAVDVYDAFFCGWDRVED